MTSASADDGIGSDVWQQCLLEGAAGLGVTLTCAETASFTVYALLLQQYNQRINLTRIVDPLEVAVKHVVDSLAAAPLIHCDDVILDMGSGTGFPGLALKIVLPQTRVLLADGTQKKIHFLRHVIRELRLRDIIAEQARVEDLNFQDRFRHAFDVITARALGPLSVIASHAAPLLAPGGRVIAYKGPEASREIKNFEDAVEGAGVPAWRIESRSYTLPRLNQPRTLVIFHKGVT